VNQKVAGNRRFEKYGGVIIENWKVRPLKVRPPGLSETSEIIYSVTWHYIPQERMP